MGGSGGAARRTCSGGLEAAQPRLEPFGVIAQPVDACEELLDFGAGGQVTALFLEVLGDAARERARRAPSPLDQVAGEVCDAAGRDVADHARKLLLEFGSRLGEQVAEALRNVGVALDAYATAPQGALAARPREREQRDRRTGNARVRGAVMTRREHHAAALGAKEDRDRRALDEEGHHAAVELAQQLLIRGESLLCLGRELQVEHADAQLRATLAAGLTPILCVGETDPEREGGKTFDVVGRQLAGGSQEIPAAAASRVILAYEPVWAIGTGKTATPAQAQEVHAFLRGRLKELWGAAADAVRILYGGSVKPDNIAALMANEDIDGALVGGASLSPESFAKIVTFQ